jgi:hypothetical protein
MTQKAIALINLAINPAAAQAIESETANLQLTSSISSGLTGAGSTLGTALVLTSIYNDVSTAAASTGVRAPSGIENGGKFVVRNRGANALTVYPVSASETINGSASFSLATNAGNTFVRASATTWFVF